ncbi:MAG TPA: hypothetical protein VFX96_15540 [Pyrinomonadaceae bacterium]|nr:hypothetical protein [Pyrinomonadaceae bacterium]
MTRAALVALVALAASGCGALAGKEETGVVIARRAHVRSSTAVVAADLKEVVRGDVLDILDSYTAENGEQWLHVRTRDTEGMEGWIESRNVIPQGMIERSRQLAREDESIPPQASGQLRASTNIRFTPDRGGNDNILMKLESGARFYIVGWRRVAKPKSAEEIESDDAPKAGSSQRGTSQRDRGEAEEKEAEDPNELWYKVRLPQSLSPAPAGWVLGKQVELTVPSDIIFYRTGREFVAWRRLDAAADNEQSVGGPVDKDAAKETRPGSWVILEKSSTRDPNVADPPDFDRIFVLGYDKDRQEHYTAYRSQDLEGRLPLRVEEQGDAKVFIVRVQDGEQTRDVRFRAFIDSRGLLKVTPLDELPKPPVKPR